MGWLVGCSAKHQGFSHRKAPLPQTVVWYKYQTVIVTVSGVAYFMWECSGSKREGENVWESPRQIQDINTTPYIIQRFISTFLEKH